MKHKNFTPKIIFFHYYDFRNTEAGFKQGGKQLNTAQPIRNQQDLLQFKNFYLKQEYHLRNHVLLTVGLNTALRISDLLSLTWNDVYNFETGTIRGHITLAEQKTGKYSCIYLNRNIQAALKLYFAEAKKNGSLIGNRYLFSRESGAAISRVQAWRIVKKAAERCCISGVISPHSLRKTFGYQAFKQGIEPVLLMDIYNHSSFSVTKRYLGIEQDDRDLVFKKISI